MNLYRNIKKLVEYGIETGLTPACEKYYSTNLLLELYGEKDYREPEEDGIPLDLEQILKALLDEAVERGIIDDNIVCRDLFDTKLMNCLLPRPSQVQKEFWENYQKSPMTATDRYYKFSQDSDYIRRYRIKKDLRWKYDSPYGELDITINLSKPEKDPKAIAAAKLAKSSGYPKCQLCAQNEGYAGHEGHPARENHRLIPLTLAGSPWALQYSPYVYYQEHCIVLNMHHTPMKISKETFERLLEFVAKFPHYFLGSNADLPVVGGSILSHDHFQGGHYEFAMARAVTERQIAIPGYTDVESEIVKWPMSVIRLRHEDPGRLTDLASHILEVWRGYTDKSAAIFAETEGTPHNTITPIARKRNGQFELDLVLRNNYATDEHPLGLYHPHAEYHHIKKENIGLIEVMGLAVLPARLKDELELLSEYMLDGREVESNALIAKHGPWAAQLKEKYASFDKATIHDILKKEVGEVFTHVLEDAGVYKCTKEGREAFMRFIDAL